MKQNGDWTKHKYPFEWSRSMDLTEKSLSKKSFL